ncbi:MAG: hypothetical protein R2822_10475 [Spirosomataceae bacterium]
MTVRPKSQLTLKHNQPIAPHASWKEHRFTFQNTKVSEIAYQQRTLWCTGDYPRFFFSQTNTWRTFKAETAEAFLQVMADLLELEIVRSHPSEDSSLTYTLQYLK